MKHYKSTFLSLGIFILAFFVSCGDSTQKQKNSPQTERKDSLVLKTAEKKKPEKNCETLTIFQTLIVAGHAVDIAQPPDSIPVRANLLILQGWNFPKEDWCNKASLCRKALSKGYRLVMPEMGKSTYSTRLYPETLAEWRQFPTRRWLTDTLMAYLQEKYCILMPEQANFVVGLSTGARGAALVSLNLPDVFRAMAALSGDYDQRRMPQERILNGFYGSASKFPERWSGEDNLITQIHRFRTPAYLGHGKLDYVSPPDQTRLFYDSLRTRYPQLKLRLSMPDWAAHDYQYWDYETDRMLAFFEEFLGKTR
ncbi:MAG: prolyl oligopeptidase family serine peptidase [Microscillaceae bacterium]|nr:prolyl oligopeptidase family serine peptidase [Microscillaceae bacterium]